MHLRYSIMVMIVGLALFSTTVFGGAIPSGYEKVAWNTDISLIQKRYPRGHLMRLGEETIYKQRKPNNTIALRNFAFRDGKLYTISVILEKRHVEKVGLEQLIGKYIDLFGMGHMDRSQAPHLINFRWEGNGSRITFAYAPKRPDMTVIMYEREVDYTEVSR